MEPAATQSRNACLGIICTLVVGWVLPTSAQYSISQYVIAGGGGQASGGAWTLDATIGQPVAGVTSGGAMVLNAGFWTTEMSGPPTLEITRAGSDVILSWPSAAIGFNLQQTPALMPSNWTQVNAVPSDDGVTKSVTLPITNSVSFFRLAR